MAKNTRIALFVGFDFICFNASFLLAYLIVCADGNSTAETTAGYFAIYPAGFLILIVVKLLAMFVCSVYKILFEYAGIRDFQRVALSLVACTLASVTVAVFLGIGAALLPFVILLSLVFDVAFVLVVRVLYVRQNMVRMDDDDPESQSLRRRYAPKRKNAGRVMIVGKDRAAADLIAEMQATEGCGRTPAIIIDDDKTHTGDILLGVEVAAGYNEIRLRARRQSIDEIIIAKPDASKRQLAILLRECVKTRCKISMLPLARKREGAEELPQAALADLCKPTIADLLGRDRPRVDHREIGDQLKGRVVLVTGGAGVFGSELCRRIIMYKPRRLVALDVDEDGLAMLAAELEGYRTAETEFHTVIASVRDQIMMRRALGAFRPHIIFHAAEIKQIPLAQINPRETFLTNVFGLKIVSDLADEYAAEKFILCSTVRAAEPLSVAAQCKRMAELYVAEKNAKSQTAYSSVRFSNLIEGRGNVITLFEKQLSKGAPLTVTDKDIVRRFISAEEAALLTVLAGAFAAGGEIFELGPGEAIGVRDLAEAVIRLAGKIPYEEADIVMTQLRPGERLFEEMDAREPEESAKVAERIWIVDDKESAKLPHWSQLWAFDLDRIDDMAVMELLRLIFPTYKTKTAGNPTRGELIEDE